MTAVVEEQQDWMLGSTTPREFTPPLPEHVDPDAEYGIDPEATWGPQCVDFLENVLGWDLIEWQKWLYYHALEKRANGTGFRFKFLLVLIGRQQGKTKWGMGLALWRMFMDPNGTPDPNWPAAKTTLLACQNLDYAEGTLKNAVDEVRDSKWLRGEFIRHMTTSGKHTMLLTGRRQWRVATGSRKGGRSLSIDHAWLDELREQQNWEAWRAITPTTTSRPNSLVVCTSNAGDVKSVVLRSLRDAALRKITTKDTDSTETGLFEWSVPDEVDPRDERFWYQAAPSMGRLNEFTINDLRAAFESMEHDDMPGFMTEYLCMWVSSLKPGIIPAFAWSDTTDKESRRAPDAKRYVCVDVNYHRTRGYVSVGALQEDGLIHTRVIHEEKGTDWIIKWLKDNKHKFTAATAQITGAPVSGLVPDIKKALKNQFVEWGTPVSQLVEGAQFFYDGITHGTIKHPPQPVLDRAAGSAVARTVGSDAWFFCRRTSPVDAAPLVACCGAVWLAKHPPKIGDAMVHSWPAEDVIEQWRREAEERYKELTQ